MSTKRQRLDYMDMKILPKEVWCIIFSYLDENSVRSASATCKLWFELIRSDLKISSHIYLGNDGLNEFGTKLEKSEWMWERWPVLKTLEFGPLSIYELYSCQEAKRAMEMVKSINFKQCETLEKVIFSVKYDLSIVHSDNQEYFWEKYHCLATVRKLTFNPQVETRSFGIEHVSRLVLTLNTCGLTSKKNKICEGLKLIGEKAECLQNLTIFIGKERDSSGDVREDFKFLISGFRSMFEGLNDSLETIHFMTSEDSHNLLVDILKLLSEHSKNLTKIVADSAFKISKFPSIGCFQNLKQLTVPKLCYIDGFVQSCDTVTDIFVEKAVMANLKNYDLGTMCQNFKKLKKCYFNVRVHLIADWRKCYEWQHIVDENFQESTEVKFVFKMKLYHVKKVTKLPYQKSTFEFLMKYEKDEMDQGLE